VFILSIKPHPATSWKTWIPYRVQNFNFQIALTDLFEYPALLTFSLTSNAKTVLTKIVSNPINVKSFQEKMGKCALCKSRNGIKGVPGLPG